jgi:cytochrome c oxidase subunit 2
MSLEAPLRALLLAAGPGYLPEQASSVAAGVDHVFAFLFWLSAFFLALIVGLSALFVVRYRRRATRPGPEASPDHSTGLELFWSIIPLLLVIGIFVASTQVYLAMTSAPGGEPAYRVKVVARKWSWAFEHPNGRKERDLHLVAGQPVELLLASVDVVHSLYVPQFRLKQDAVPGRYTKMTFTPTRAGSYPILCAEYCGTNHSQMSALAVVHPDQADYDAWAGQGVLPGQLSLVDLGKKVFDEKGCSACHEIEPEDPKKEKGIGPSLFGLWGRLEKLNGGATVKVDENYLRESIVKPGAKIVAGYEDLMSPFPLEEQEMLGIIAYLQGLSPGQAGAAHPPEEPHERDEKHERDGQGAKQDEQKEKHP